MTLQTIGIVIGFVALGWAFAVRRSPADCIMAALCGVLLLMLAMGWVEPLRFPPYSRLPELALAGLGIALLVRAFVSRNRPPAVAASDSRGRAGPGEGAGFTPQYMGQLPPRVQNAGLIIIGVIVLIPLLLLALVVGAFMWGGIGYQERAREAEDRRTNPAVESAVKTTLQLPAAARFRHHGWSRSVVANRYVLPSRSRCGEYMAEGMQGFRGFIYAFDAGPLFVADERGMLRFHNFRRAIPIDPEVGRPIAAGEQPQGRVEEAPWSAFCGEAAAG